MIKSYLQHQTGFQNKRHIIVAAMPPLLFALGLSLMWLVAGGKRWYEIPRWRLYASLAIGLLPNVIIFLGAVVAVFRRIPAWGYTWVGTVLLGLFFLLQGIAEELIENGIYPFSAAAENTVGVMLLLVYVMALGAIAMRGWWQAGLVSIGMASIFGLSICHTLAIPPFNRQDLALLSLPMALMISMLIYTYIQGNLLRKVLVFVFVELLNVGIALVAAQVWQTHEGVLYALIGLMSGVLLAGPLLSLIGFPLRQRMQPQV